MQKAKYINKNPKIRLQKNLHKYTKDHNYKKASKLQNRHIYIM